MGIIARQSVANAIYTWSGIGLGALLTLGLYPAILEPEQYGLTRVLLSISLIATQFAHLGMRNTVIRFFPLFHSRKGEANGLLFLALTVPLVGFLLFAGLFMLFKEPLLSLFSERSPLLNEYALFILPITLFILYYEILNSYLRSLRDSVSGSLVSEVILRLGIIAVLIIYLLNLVTFYGFLILFSATYALQPLILLFRLIRAGWFKPQLRTGFLRLSLLRGMSSYGLYTLFGGLATVLVWNVDILMVSSLAGLADTAVYAIAFYIGTIIAVPQRAIEKITTPLISEMIHKHQWDQVATLYRNSSIAQTIAGSALLLLVWANSEPLFALLPEAYRGGELVVLLIGLGKLADMATGTNGSIILTSRHYRFDLLANLILVLFTVTINLILIPRFGIEGAAAATALSLFIYNLVKTVYLYRVQSIHPFGRTHAGILLLAGFSFIMIGMLPPMTLPASMAVSMVMVILLFLVPVWRLGLSSPVEQELARRLPGRLREWFLRSAKSE